MKKIYYIQAITYKDGTPKADNKAKRRIGNYIDIEEDTIDNGRPLIATYRTKDKDDYFFGKTLFTTPVECVIKNAVIDREEPTGLKEIGYEIQTENSVYFLEYVGDVYGFKSN